jgi:SAM-dependent methyltransferase
MIIELLRKKLDSLWTRALDRVIVPLLPPKLANLLQCSKIGLWNEYFIEAESAMQNEWDEIIWPLIKTFNFDVVLELAPGAGRNTEKLCTISKKIYAVDYNSYAIEQCRERLGSSYRGCDIEYYVNNGTDLKVIQDDAISTIYCWDAAVHFGKSILDSYIKECARVLRVGGQGFIHHSNLGDKASKNIKKNPRWRSNVSKESFAEICETNGLRIVAQVDIPWGRIVDCVTIFEKTAQQELLFGHQSIAAGKLVDNLSYLRPEKKSAWRNDITW